jgi:hypothetical protein
MRTQAKRLMRTQAKRRRRKAIVCLALVVLSCALACDGLVIDAECDPRPFRDEELPCLRDEFSSQRCSETPSTNWQGCRATGCGVCPDALQALGEYPFYFENHPCCDRNETCDGDYYPCSSVCPEPDPLDRLPKCSKISD